MAASGETSIRQCLLQVSAIIVFSSLLALSVNALRPGGIPLVRERSAGAGIVDGHGMRMDIPMEEAVSAFEQNSAVFLDARSIREYEQGHIRGARMLPWNEADEYVIDATADIPPDLMVITYCDGQGCTLSHDLALYLRNFGFERVYVLVNGWGLWLEYGLPVEQGTDAVPGRNRE